MSNVKSDIEIARNAKIKPIKDILSKFNIPDDPFSFSPMGRHIAKLNLEYISTLKEKESNLILVTAITPTPAGEGKTTTISNLAITFANLGKKTLLIDTDLRKPVMHTVFSKKQSPGLTDYLMGKEDEVEKIINKTDIDNFS